MSSIGAPLQDLQVVCVEEYAKWTLLVSYSVQCIVHHFASSLSLPTLLHSYYSHSLLLAWSMHSGDLGGDKQLSFGCLSNSSSSGSASRPSPADASQALPMLVPVVALSCGSSWLVPVSFTSRCILNSFLACDEAQQPSSCRGLWVGVLLVR